MKRSILAVFAAAATVAVSCKKQEAVNPAIVTSSVEIQLGSPATKAFGDGTTEPFEKELHNVTVFVYETGAGNNCVLVRPFTAYELGKQKAVFTIPDMKAEASYDFYAVANCTSTDLTDETSMIARDVLEAKYEGVDGSTSPYGTLSSYNSSFTNVTTKAVRGAGAANTDNTGFIMSGKITERTSAKGTNVPTIVNLPMRRTVAKVAVKAALTSEFYAAGKYPEGSTLKITNARLRNVVKGTTLFAKNTTPTIALQDDPLVQTPNVVGSGRTAEYQNLFYIYENGIAGQSSAVVEANRPVLELDAEFDFDGDPNTTADISNLTYSIKLAGEAGNSTNTSDANYGLFVRNGNYLVNVLINGLTENEVVASVEVKDWETLKTQTVTIGQ